MRLKHRVSRKSERGTTVLIVVMVTTLITAIGVFAVRNIAEIDRAVGYGRQAAQTLALAELGTTAAMAQIGTTGTAYSREMDRHDETDTANPTKPLYKCLANRPFESSGGASCFPLSQERMEGTTTTNGGETLLEPAVAGTEVGSFGAIGNMTGNVSVELTEKRSTKRPIAGSEGSAVDVTVTSTAVISPIPQGTADPCGGGASMVAVKKVMRAHVIIPPDLESGT